MDLVLSDAAATSELQLAKSVSSHFAYGDVAKMCTAPENAIFTQNFAWSATRHMVPFYFTKWIVTCYHIIHIFRSLSEAPHTLPSFFSALEQRQKGYRTMPDFSVGTHGEASSGQSCFLSFMLLSSVNCFATSSGRTTFIKTFFLKGFRFLLKFTKNS